MPPHGAHAHVSSLHSFQYQRCLFRLSCVGGNRSSRSLILSLFLLFLEHRFYLCILLSSSPLSSPPPSSSGWLLVPAAVPCVVSDTRAACHGEGCTCRGTHVQRGGRQTLTLSAGESSWAKNSTTAEEGDKLEKTNAGEK